MIVSFLPAEFYAIAIILELYKWSFFILATKNYGQSKCFKSFDKTL